MTETIQRDNEVAYVNVTFNNLNGELPDPVVATATPNDVKAWVAEALRTGGIRGIPAQEDPDLTGYKVDPPSFSEARQALVMFVRPGTPFGA